MLVLTAIRVLKLVVERARRQAPPKVQIEIATSNVVFWVQITPPSAKEDPGWALERALGGTLLARPALEGFGVALQKCKLLIEFWSIHRILRHLLQD